MNSPSICKHICIHTQTLQFFEHQIVNPKMVQVMPLPKDSFQIENCIENQKFSQTSDSTFLLVECLIFGVINLRLLKFMAYQRTQSFFFWNSHEFF